VQSVPITSEIHSHLHVYWHCIYNAFFLKLILFNYIFQPQNILLTQPFPKGDIKLCDLGFACLVNTGEDIRDIIGTVDYVGMCVYP
jgi:serine/threonine protein kinase